jgi:hypothetical protein
MTSNNARTPSRNWQTHLPFPAEKPTLDLHIRLYDADHETAALTPRRDDHELHVEACGKKSSFPNEVPADESNTARCAS